MEQENSKRIGFNKHRLVIFTALVAVAAMLFSFMPAGTTLKASNSAVKGLENQIANIEKKLDDLESKITSTESNLDKELRNKSYIDTKLVLFGESIDATNKLIDEYDRRISEKEQEIADKEADIEQKYKEFKEWLKASYEYGDASYVEMILNTDSFTDFLSSVERIANIIEYQNDLMIELDENLSTLMLEKSELDVYKSEQLTTKNSLLDQEKTYESLAKTSANYISTLKNDRSKLSSEYDKAQKEINKLNEELKEELERLAKQNTVYIGGDFIWPVETKYTRISSGYGMRGKEFHLGIDIPAAYGTNIYASNGGKVIKSTYHHSYGYYTLIDHGGGRATLYAHCSKLLVSVGDTVTQGQVIALIGSTGYSTGNHIHFEIRINGSAVNPLEYLAVP